MARLIVTAAPILNYADMVLKFAVSVQTETGELVSSLLAEDFIVSDTKYIGWKGTGFTQVLALTAKEQDGLYELTLDWAPLPSQARGLFSYAIRVTRKTYASVDHGLVVVPLILLPEKSGWFSSFFSLFG